MYKSIDVTTFYEDDEHIEWELQWDIEYDTSSGGGYEIQLDTATPSVVYVEKGEAYDLYAASLTEAQFLKYLEKDPRFDIDILEGVALEISAESRSDLEELL